MDKTTNEKMKIQTKENFSFYTMKLNSTVFLNLVISLRFGAAKEKLQENRIYFNFNFSIIPRLFKIQ
jgi:hypothetical protein